ncbi:MAG TPA: efflux RND transporter permease subunit [Terriglobales bacterium]|nr:efflux RND transporter permease subunit [Terriglobales bacterium]
MLNALIRWSLHHRLLVLTLAAILLLFGIDTARRAPIEVFPNFAPPQVVIQTEAPGFSPAQVEQQVTTPLELALLGINGVVDVRSSSIVGVSAITVYFADSTNIWTDRQQVSEAITAAAQLPPTVNPPQLAPVTSAIGLLEVVGLTSTSAAPAQDPFNLRTFADWILRPRLLAVPGVANVTVFGDGPKQMQVTVSPQRLQQLSLSLSDILTATQAASTQGAGGYFHTAGQDLVIHAAGLASDPNALAASVVASRNGVPITLGDVAQIGWGAPPAIGGASVNGQPGVVLQIFKQPGANTVEVSNAVDQTIAALARNLPPGIALAPGLFRQATFISLSIHELRTAMIEGSLLVMLVLLLFLRDPRTALISVVAMPLSLLIALLILVHSGATLNTMTLGGLVLALGEVVDDAIIDVENITRRLRGAPPTESVFNVVFNASAEVRGSVVYATVAVALVFLPVFFLTGLEGRIFAPMGEAYILATLSSLLVALTVTPALSLWLLPVRAQRPSQHRISLWLQSRYDRLAARALPHPRLIGTLSLLIAAAALAALPFMGGAFLPSFNEGTAIVHMVSLNGTSLDENLRVGRAFERRLLASPDVASVAQRTGRAELGEDISSLSQSEFDVRFRPGQDNESALEDVVHNATALYPEFAWAVEQYISERMNEVLAGDTAAVSVEFFGPDLNQLQALASQAQALITAVPGALDVQMAEPIEAAAVEIQIDRAAIKDYSLTSAQVTQAVQAALVGAPAGVIYDGQKNFDLVVKLPTPVADNLDLLRQLPIATPARAPGATTPVPLSALARIAIVPSLAVITHAAGSRMVAVTANFGGQNLTGFVARIQSRLAASLRLPPDYSVRYSGQFQSRSDAVRSLAWLGSVALLAIAFLLYSAFESGRNTALLLFNLPLAFIGGIAAVLLSRSPISVATLIGFITLFGITLRNGIMLVTHYHHLQQFEGMPFGRDLALRGARERLLPILMTALVTGLALLPIALGGNAPGRAMEFPMAIVILGGLISSTLLNLIILPSLYLRYGHPYQR